MTARLANAALAVSITVAALTSVTSRTEAAPFTVQVDGPTGADGGVGFILTGDSAATTGQFSFGESEQAPNFVDFLSTNFEDPNARYNLSNVGWTTDPFGVETRFADFTVSDPTFSFVVTTTDFFGTGLGPKTITGYSLTFRVTVPYDPATDTYYEGEGAASTLLIPPASVLPIGQAFVTGNPFVNTVPLPASLPLMAGAMIGFGMIGVATRWRKR